MLDYLCVYSSDGNKACQKLMRVKNLYNTIDKADSYTQF